jgi:hypothetical protein
MLYKISSIITAIASIAILNHTTFGQGGANPVQTNEYLNNRLNELNSDLRPVQSAVPFLMIAPDARSAAIGDQGVATSPDAYSTYWNAAKICHSKEDYGFAITYNPWLRKIINDMSLANLSGYYRLRKEDAIGINLTYFDLGAITFTDQTGAVIQDFRPNEFSLGAMYSRLLGKGFSTGVGLKYIYSNLAGNISNNGNIQARPAQAAAADIGIYYTNDIYMFDNDFNLTLGAAIANIGNKVSYSNTSRADFLPTNLRVGSTLTYNIDEYNKFSLMVQASKLLVPSSQIVPVRDSTGAIIDYRLQVPNKSLVNGIFSSFGDAPGGFREEMQEIMLHGGLEYWYDDMFAIRGGYFYENPKKGNRNYFTVGFGIRYNVIGIDLSYLVATTVSNPLAETLRFAINFNFNKPKTKAEQSVTD